MAFIAQFFVCRVVVANYYWSLMISAVAALDTKPVKPLSCHVGKIGNMKMHHHPELSFVIWRRELAFCNQEFCCCWHMLSP